MEESDIFRHELSSIPASMFDDDGIMKSPVKPDLAKAITKVCRMDISKNKLPGSEVAFVLDGGSLLHRIQWLVLKNKMP